MEKEAGMASVTMTHDGKKYNARVQLACCNTTQQARHGEEAIAKKMALQIKHKHDVPACMMSQRAGWETVRKFE